MPKKKSFGVNSKKEEGRLRKESKQRQEKEKERIAAENAKWKDPGNPLKKKLEREQAEEEKKRKKAERELEKKEQLANEYKNIKSKNENKGKNKKTVTKYQLQQNRLAYLQNLIKINDEAEVVPVNNLPLERNTNRDDNGVVLDGIDDALDFLEGNDKGVDRHPEKRRKAAWNAYREKMYEEIKAEYPTLKRSQINERIFKEWQKSPENPMNQDNGE